MRPMTKSAVKLDDIRRRAARVMWACGLLFAVLLLLGISGVASVTLIYEDEQYFQAIRGVEGAVARTVLDLKWLIQGIHGVGGYVGAALAAWAGYEVFRFGRMLRRTDNAGWRIKGRRLPWIGATGSILVIVALGALIVSGFQTADFLGGVPADQGELEAPISLEDGGHTRNIEAEPAPVVDWHTRELNFGMALGAILLALAASSVRGVVNEARDAQEPGDNEK